MPWELLNPAGLALLGLAAPLIALYLLKVRRQRRVVPSLWLYRAAARDLQAQSPFRRLVPSIPLLLELLTLFLLAVSLAQPVTRTGRFYDSHLVMVVDVSASLGAVENGELRLQRAIGAARDVLGRVAPGTQVMLLAAGRGVELVSPFERDIRRLERALEELSVHEVEGHIEPAMALASDQLRERGGGRIVLVTDGAIAGAENLVATRFPVEVVQVDGTRDNTAIVRTEVARKRDPVTLRDRVEVFALIAHHSERPREVFVTLNQRNVAKPLTSRKLRLAPGERVPIVLGFDAAQSDSGSGLILELSPPDALASDDRTTVRIPPSRKVPVVLAPKGYWLERALRADPDVELSTTDIAGLLVPGNVPDDALVILDGACPERLPGADLLILNPPPGPCRTAQVGPTVELPQLTSWAETDARFRHLTFDGVQIARARILTPERPAAGLLRSQHGVLIADISSPNRNGTLIGFDLGASNWPLKASFVLFVRNLVELARAQRASSLSAPLRTGEPISLRVPMDVDSVTLEHVSGRRETVSARSGLVVIPAPTQVGFLHVSWQGNTPGSSLIPTSLASEAESQIGSRALPYSNTPPSSTATLPGTAGLSSLTWVFSLAALLFVALHITWITRQSKQFLSRTTQTPRAPERGAPLGDAS